MRCPNCNNSIPEDSSFCHYCGSKITRTEQADLFGGNPREDARQKKRAMLGKAILIVFALFVGITIFGNYFGESEPKLEPVAEPRSGTILTGSEDLYGSEITISASAGESCVVKLKTKSGTTRLSFYVRAGDTVTVGVPCEYLYVYFATGDTWYGQNHLFGEDTSYSMDDEICDFTEYTWEYTLYPVSSGNFSETPIAADDF